MTGYIIKTAVAEHEYKTFGRARNMFLVSTGVDIISRNQIQRAYTKSGEAVEFFPAINLDNISDDVADLVMDDVIDAPAEAPSEIKVRKVCDSEYNVNQYTKCKSANGNFSLDNGDMTAQILRGQPLDEVYAIAAASTGRPETELRNRYAHLNPGMQRMNLGNLIRRT